MRPEILHFQRRPGNPPPFPPSSHSPTPHTPWALNQEIPAPDASSLGDLNDPIAFFGGCTCLSVFPLPRFLPVVGTEPHALLACQKGKLWAVLGSPLPQIGILCPSRASQSLEWLPKGGTVCIEEPQPNFQLQGISEHQLEVTSWSTADGQ